MAKRQVTSVFPHRSESPCLLHESSRSNLSFKEQVDRLETKISRKIGAVSRAFGKMTLDCRRMYYLSLIQPDLEYASNAYVRCLSHGDLQRLVKLSKRAIRAVFNLPFWHHTQPLFDKLNLARIDKRFDLKLYCHTYRCLNELASPLLCSVFTRIATNESNFRTRGSAHIMLRLPKVSTSHGLKSISFNSADCWNSLPSDIRCSNSLISFRNSCADFIGCPRKRPLSVGPPN